MPPQDRSLGLVHLGLTLITHALLLSPAIYIVVLSAQLNYSLFIWHPTCMAVGCGLLMTEAIFAVSGQALLGSSISRTGRIKLHWILHVLGLSLLVIGFGVIIANKIRNGADHFTSDHGKLGLSTVIITLVVALGGFSTLFAGFLSQKLSLATVKLIHVCGGIIAMTLLLSALITGLYRGWWPGSELGRSLSFAAYVIGGFFVLIKPLYAWLLKVRGILN